MTHLLTVPELATRLRVSRMTVYRLIADGLLPAYRIGRSYRIDAADADTWLRRAGL